MHAFDCNALYGRCDTHKRALQCSEVYSALKQVGKSGNKFGGSGVAEATNCLSVQLLLCRPINTYAEFVKKGLNLSLVCPARCPDLTCLYYFTWGHSKSEVYSGKMMGREHHI